MKKINKENIVLKEEDFSFVCPLKTEDMTVVEGGYFCAGCEKKVHDVSDMTQNEYNALVDKTENVCVSFKKVATVSLVLSLAACATPPKQEKRLTGFLFDMDSTHNNLKKPNKTTDKNATVPQSTGIVGENVYSVIGKPRRYKESKKEEKHNTNNKSEIPKNMVDRNNTIHIEYPKEIPLLGKTIPNKKPEETCQTLKK